MATVKKGTITVPSRGTGRTFMFNPNDVSDDKTPNYGSIDLPGASHPVQQFGSGGERLISFQLFFDGDRGRIAARGKYQKDVVELDTIPLSIKDELMWYRSLIYPSKYGAGYYDVAPYLVLFSMGELYDNVKCIVKAAPFKVNFWTPKMEPVRATMDFKLSEVVDRSVTSDDILAQGGLTAYEFGE